MFNVKVLRLKDIIKYLIGIFVTIIIIVLATKCLNSLKQNKDMEKVSKVEENKENDINKDKENSLFDIFFNCLDVTVPAMASINKEYNQTEKENKEIEENNYLLGILKTEISAIEGMENLEKDKKEQEEGTDKNNEKKNEENKEDISLASTDNIVTEVVTPNPITESFNVQYGNVKIKNQTTYALTEDILKPDIKIDNKNVLIFHTHSCESYTPSEKYPYTQTREF